MASHKVFNCINPKYYIVVNTLIFSVNAETISVRILLIYGQHKWKMFVQILGSYMDSTNGKCLCKYLPLAPFGAGAFV